MNIYSIDQNTLSKNINNANREFLAKMVQEGVLTEKNLEDASKYAIAIVEKSAWGRFWDKLWNADQSGLLTVIVKVLD